MITTLPLHVFIGFTMVESLGIATLLNLISNFSACITFGTSLSKVFLLPLGILLCAMVTNWCGQFLGGKISIKHSDKTLWFITLVSMMLLFIYLVYKYWILG